MSRYYNPYYPRSVGAGMAAFMFKPEDQYRPQTSQYYLPDRRRQVQPELNYQPQQNEIFYPQVVEQSEPLPEQAIVPEQPVAAEKPVAIPEQPVVTEPADLPEPTEKTELIASTIKSVAVPELSEPEPEPESEEVPKPAPVPRKRVTKKKQVKRPVDEDEEEIDDYAPPRMPTGAYFPMFFGWGGRSGNGAPSGGATAIANAFSTGRGGVATSHATAYGPPKQDSKL